MAVRDIERKLKKLETEYGVMKIEMVLKDGSVVQFDTFESGLVMIDSLAIMNAKALGNTMPTNSEESLLRIKQWAEISYESLEKHPEYRWTVGLAGQCLGMKQFTEEQKYELERSCKGEYFEALERNGKLMLNPGKRPPIATEGSKDPCQD